MPYPRAHYYVLFVIAVIVAGFWTSYFSVFGVSPWQFHAHGMAASLWVLMVLAQSWTAHHKPQLPLHRAVGKSSLLLFPFLIGGLAAIIDVTGKGFVAGDGPVRAMFGAEFLVGLLVAMAAYVVLYYRALKHRRQVWLHSGYMLGTPIILFESPFSRILGEWVPAFAVNGPQDFDRILQSILVSDALALAFCIAAWWRLRERATPFLVTGGFVALQLMTMGVMGDVAWLETALRLIGDAPSSAVVGTGIAIGALTSWAGWQAGKRPAIRSAAAAQPA
ncbi:hypothetical protein H9L12_09925 [Sphingomonas rhizophila]|uniref:Uncharacterized protein n=1 Tax=Sphingomonas rhizophila TaxID=2071607 RepID=A0A7G9S9T2_9SPHN|nr:hypothetical protein [Sphingomonas rhizophila]QNN64607.1 hypothetical protein H9L12_09925 [Sphingomonas rhizophila]